ncbi:ABC transporter ATP-binding protein [Duganella rhizosphaerae]|uniref:cyclic peptide export ABC transporter n=1 Tax=Duganella rhizosphaerae TaxID=2885763 RepID=UPI0030E8717E
MKLLSYIYRHAGRLLLLATLSSIVSGISGAALVGVIGKGLAGDGAALLPLAGAFFALCVLNVASKSYAEVALLRTTQTAIFHMRTEISRKLLATPLRKLQELGKPGLLTILTKDIDIVIGAFQLLPAAFGNLIVIAACLAYMAWLSWQLFLIYVVCLVVCVAGFTLAERRPMAQLVRVRQHIDQLYAYFRDLIEGSKELQLNARRGTRFVDDVIAPSAERFRHAYSAAMIGYTTVNNVGMILFYLIIGVLLFLVPLWLPQGAEVLATTTLILMYLIKPIADMTAMVPALRQAGISMDKVEQLNGALDAPAPGAAAPAFARQAPLRLQLRQVCHRYPGLTEDHQFMLGPLDLTIAQGECVFIIGGNGSGKTTLAMLLLGLYLPEGGHIALNGEAVTADNVDQYRQHFSAVFADFHLFEHLLVERGAALEARATEFIAKFGLAHKVSIEDGKFSTRDLSTGQRKRLALVSAYLEDRPVYLFDEWAADQDPAFKRVFYTELLPELKARGKTVLVISHDDGYFDCADRIIKLADGQLQAVAGEHAATPGALHVA